jgi:urease accessory protein
MRIAEPRIAESAASWKAELSLGFERVDGRTVLARKRHHGPLVVQRALYPEGGDVCHAIVVHPPAGVAGGDELALAVQSGKAACAQLTTPGAGKWYRSAGPWAAQRLSFDVEGALEWLPQETIVFDGALADLSADVRLGDEARYVGWEILCLGRTGSGERFTRGSIRLSTRISRSGKLVWFERGRIEGGGKLMQSPAGLGGHTVCGTLVAAAPEISPQRADGIAVTRLPGLLVARYLGDSSEEAKHLFARFWASMRPQLLGREAQEPRIWRT